MNLCCFTCTLISSESDIMMPTKISLHTCFLQNYTVMMIDDEKFVLNICELHVTCVRLN